MIYLDSASTTPIDKRVLDAMLPYLQDNFGNAGSIHSIGRQAANAIFTARKQVANLIGCEPEHIIFTSGGTEANNLAIRGTTPYLEKINKHHIISTEIEHDSVINTIDSVCNPLCHNNKNDIKSCFYSTLLKPNRNGTIPLNNLISAINSNTGLVSVMYVNNEIGSVNPIKEIAEICNKHNVILHTDCVQALGFQEINVNDINCDLLSLSAHKINAPKGIGALYVKDLDMLSPIINGGKSQEFGLRGGTENVAGIVGFGMACELIDKDTVAFRHEQIHNLKQQFEKGLVQSFKELNIDKLLHINSPENSKILNIRIDKVDGQTLVMLLDSNNIYVSSSSACRSHETKPSRVLTSIGLSEEEAKSSIRISFHDDLSKEDMCSAIKVISNCVFKLNQLNFS